MEYHDIPMIFLCFMWHVPSGELTVCHGKSPFLMGKSSISMAIFHSFLYVHQRVYINMIGTYRNICFMEYHDIPMIFLCFMWHVPSGELTFCHGKSTFLMGKSSISMAIFHSFLYVHQRVYINMIGTYRNIIGIS